MKSRMVDNIPFGYGECHGFIRNLALRLREPELTLKFPAAPLINNQLLNLPATDRTGAVVREALPLINATIAGFHAMANTECGLVRPLMLRITNAPRGAMFAEPALNSPPVRNAAARLRLLNGLYPNGEPATEQPLKIIE